MCVLSIILDFRLVTSKQASKLAETEDQEQKIPQERREGNQLMKGTLGISALIQI